MTSVKGKPEKWQSLQRKLKRGKTLEQASIEAGVDLEEAEAMLKERRDRPSFENDALAMVGAEALHYGIKTLIALTQIRDGRIGGEGGGAMATKFDHPDLPAAQTLVRAGLDIKKMLLKKESPGGEPGDDLFDKAGSSGGNWSFTDRDK